MVGQQDPLQDRLTRAFFVRPVLEVAPELLGCTVTHAGVTIRLTEVEAYDGTNDPGSHAFRGPTPRTQVMFGEPGGLYVYFTYGMHWCANLVCGSAGSASAVLLRAGEVIDGIEVARTRREGANGRLGDKGRAGVSDRDLARGPARLAMALSLAGDQNGIDAVAIDSQLVVRATAPADLLAGSARPAGAVVRTGPRVGVSGPGGEGTAYPWRFWLEGEATVSSYRPGTVRRSKPPVRSGDP